MTEFTTAQAALLQFKADAESWTQTGMINPDVLARQFQAVIGHARSTLDREQRPLFLMSRRFDENHVVGVIVPQSLAQQLWAKERLSVREVSDTAFLSDNSASRGSIGRGIVSYEADIDNLAPGTFLAVGQKVRGQQGFIPTERVTNPYFYVFNFYDYQRLTQMARPDAKAEGAKAEKHDKGVG